MLVVIHWNNGLEIMDWMFWVRTKEKGRKKEEKKGMGKILVFLCTSSHLFSFLCVCKTNVGMFGGKKKGRNKKGKREGKKKRTGTA